MLVRTPGSVNITFICVCSSGYVFRYSSCAAINGIATPVLVNDALNYTHGYRNLNSKSNTELSNYQHGCIDQQSMKKH